MTSTPTAARDPIRVRRWAFRALWIGLLVVVAIVRLGLGLTLGDARLAAWTTVFVAICVQSAPFLALGAAVSALVAVVVPARALRRALPRRAMLAVPVGALAGGLLPGCECSAVPVAASLQRRGVPPAAAMSFLVAAPAINPVVLGATAVAFRGHPTVVLARLVASLATALVVGWAWLRVGGSGQLAVRAKERAGGPGGRAGHAAEHAAVELTRSLGLVTIGAAAAATLNVIVPPGWLHELAVHQWLSVGGLGVLAVALAVCSEADAFVAASLVQFSLTARLVFMVVGPVVDLKLVAAHIGSFGRRSAVRFVPLAWIAAVCCGIGVGSVLR